MTTTTEMANLFVELFTKALHERDDVDRYEFSRRRTTEKIELEWRGSNASCKVTFYDASHVSYSIDAYSGSGGRLVLPVSKNEVARLANVFVNLDPNEFGFGGDGGQS